MATPPGKPNSPANPSQPLPHQPLPPTPTSSTPQPTQASPKPAIRKPRQRRRTESTSRPPHRSEDQKSGEHPETFSPREYPPCTFIPLAMGLLYYAHDLSFQQLPIRYTLLAGPTTTRIPHSLWILHIRWTALLILNNINSRVAPRSRYMGNLPMLACLPSTRIPFTHRVTIIIRQADILPTRPTLNQCWCILQLARAPILSTPRQFLPPWGPEVVSSASEQNLE